MFKKRARAQVDGLLPPVLPSNTVLTVLFHKTIYKVWNDHIFRDEPYPSSHGGECTLTSHGYWLSYNFPQFYHRA